MRTKDEEQPVRCCLSCYRILELYEMRHFALVFHSENTVKELKKLKVKMIDQWDGESLKYLVELYKNSKKDGAIRDELAADRRRKFIRKVQERAATAQSVTKTSTFSIPNRSSSNSPRKVGRQLSQRTYQAATSRRTNTIDTDRDKRRQSQGLNRDFQQEMNFRTVSAHEIEENAEFGPPAAKKLTRGSSQRPLSRNRL